MLGRLGMMLASETRPLRFIDSFAFPSENLNIFPPCGSIYGT